MQRYRLLAACALSALLCCQSGQPADTATTPQEPLPAADTAYTAIREAIAPEAVAPSPQQQAPKAGHQERAVPPPQSKTPAPPQPETPPAAPVAEPEQPTPQAQAPDHSPWNALLQRHVDSKGKVNYRGFRADQQLLADYLQALAGQPPQAEWSRQEKMAYWINAYNAFTVALIVEHYPVKSILDLDNGKTWDVPRIRLGGKNYSLNQIENEILRPQFKDARIHFALNCAARSCPPLWNQAFSAVRLSQELDSRTRAFINHPGFNTLDEAECQVSKIFEWYAEDFGDLRTYLNRYAQKQIPETARIRFGAYDWSLNE